MTSTIVAVRFNEENFRERLKDNPFVASLAAVPRRPDRKQLEDDMKLVIDTHPTVKKLNMWRNNYFSHRSQISVLNMAVFTQNNPLLLTDLEELVKTGLEIVGRYSNLFSATHHGSLLNPNDFKVLLDAVRERIKSYEAKVEAEMNQIAAACSGT